MCKYIAYSSHYKFSYVQMYRSIYTPIHTGGGGGVD